MRWEGTQGPPLSQLYPPQKSTMMKLSQRYATPTQPNESRPTPSSTKTPTPASSANSKKNSPIFAPNSAAIQKTTTSTHPYLLRNSSSQSANQMGPLSKYRRQRSPNNY